MEGIQIWLSVAIQETADGAVQLFLIIRDVNGVQRPVNWFEFPTIQQVRDFRDSITEQIEGYEKEHSLPEVFRGVLNDGNL